MTLKIDFQDVQICMLTCNEELLLEFTLSELKGLFAKFLIVDQSSTDRTVEIIRDLLGDSVDLIIEDEAYIRRIGFAGARNRASDLCTRPWLLHVDADEQVVDLAKQGIILSEAADPATDYIKVPRRNLGALEGVELPLDVAKIAQLPVNSKENHIRLYKRSAGLRWQGFIHEELRQNGRYLSADPPSGSIVLNHLSQFKGGQSAEDKEDFYGWMLMKGLNDPPTPEDELTGYSIEVVKELREYLVKRSENYQKKLGISPSAD